MDPGNPGKSWNFILGFRTAKSWKINAGPGNLETLVIKFSFKTIFCSISFGFLFCKGLLLQ